MVIKFFSTALPLAYRTPITLDPVTSVVATSLNDFQTVDDSQTLNPSQPTNSTVGPAEVGQDNVGEEPALLLAPPMVNLPRSTQPTPELSQEPQAEEEDEEEEEDPTVVAQPISATPPPTLDTVNVEGQVFNIPLSLASLTAADDAAVIAVKQSCSSYKGRFDHAAIAHTMNLPTLSKLTLTVREVMATSNPARQLVDKVVDSIDLTNAIDVQMALRRCVLLDERLGFKLTPEDFPAPVRQLFVQPFPAITNNDRFTTFLHYVRGVHGMQGVDDSVMTAIPHLKKSDMRKLRQPFFDPLRSICWPALHRSQFDSYADAENKYWTELINAVHGYCKPAPWARRPDCFHAMYHRLHSMLGIPGTSVFTVTDEKEYADTKHQLSNNLRNRFNRKDGDWHFWRLFLSLDIRADPVWEAKIKRDFFDLPWREVLYLLRPARADDALFVIQKLPVDGMVMNTKYQASAWRYYYNHIYGPAFAKENADSTFSPCISNVG